MLNLQGELEARYEVALAELQKEVPRYSIQQASEIIQCGQVGKIPPVRREGVITWGREIPLGVCEALEVTFGRLHFRAINLVDAVRISGRIRIHLVNIEAQERNQCALLQTVAGTQWARGGVGGVPSVARVLGGANEWRREEFHKAQSALQAGWARTRPIFGGSEKRSSRRDQLWSR